MLTKFRLQTLDVGLYGALLLILVLPYIEFMRSLFQVWGTDAEFAHGILIPPIVAYLLWVRREQLKIAKKEKGWTLGLIVTFIGCILLILTCLSSSLLLGSVSLALSLMGLVGYLWGRECFRIVLLPLSVLILMAPIPSYIFGELSWHLKVHSSSISSMILRSIGIPVYQDGNLLRLPNYILEVREACSGTRSLFALLALAVVLGISAERKWWKRFLLAATAPLLAVSANVTRIVGTGVIARYHGNLAASESLHSAWGIVVFLGAVVLLLGVQRLLRWRENEST